MCHGPCTAYLVRHGATDSNLADPPILQGRTINGPLSPTGRDQAAAAAAALRSLPIKAVYASPLVRAHETASLIAQPHGLAIITVEQLIEVDVGEWERRSWHEIEASEPEAYQRFQQDPANHGYRGGESLIDVSNRVMPAFQQVMQSHAGEEIVIVAHNVVNRVALANALNLPIAQARTLTQDNCGINTLRWKEDRIKVVSVNERLHLR